MTAVSIMRPRLAWATVSLYCHHSVGVMFQASAVLPPVIRPYRPSLAQRSTWLASIGRSRLKSALNGVGTALVDWTMCVRAHCLASLRV